MANFYTEDKISISTLEDIVSRPHFESSVAPRKSFFSHVLAAYSLPRKIASCSVSNCYQNHKKGYLVRYSKDQECCVCENCAKLFLEPEALKPPKATRTRAAGGSTSRRTRKAPAAVLTREIEVDLFSTESQQIKERVKELKLMPKGANWLYQSLNNFQRAYPTELLSTLKELQAGAEESSVYERLVEREASDKQLQDVEQLEGLGVFGDDIQQLLIERILKPLKVLDEKAKTVASGETLRVAVEWTEQVEADLGKAEKLLEQAQLFFTEANISRLQSLPLEDKAAQTLRKQRWNCDKGTVASK